MSHWEHPSRRTLVITGVVLFGLLVAALHYTASPSGSPTEIPVAEIQEPHDAGREFMSDLIPEKKNGEDYWYCSCMTIPEEERMPPAVVEPVEIPEPAEPIEPVEPVEPVDPVIIPNTFPPPPDELVEKIEANAHGDRSLIVAVANYGMRDYVYNWIESLKRTGEGEKFLVFCLEAQLCAHMTKAGYENHAAIIPDDWFNERVDSRYIEFYHTDKRRTIAEAKIRIAQRLLYLNVVVLLSDVDVVWLRPRARDFIHTYIQIRGLTEMVVQQDTTNQRQVSNGLFMMRLGGLTKRLLAETLYIHENSSDTVDALNLALDNANLQLRETSVTLLDILHFPTSEVYFDKALPMVHGIEPYLVHANYLTDEEKKRRLLEHNLWFVNSTWLADVDAKAA